MIPNEVISSSSLSALLFYTICLGILLLIGTILRLKIPFFKKYIIPASLIAGFVGLALGPYGLQFLPEGMVSTWGGYAGILISIVFAPMLMGMRLNLKRFKETQALEQMAQTWNASFIQWGIPLLLTALLFTPVFGVNPLFGTLTEIGYSGGHGTAGGMTEVFNDLGWPEGASLALTVATIGLVTGIFGGVIIINYGVRKGYTNYIGKNDKVSSDNSPDLIPLKEQTPSSMETVKSNVIDGYAFHFALISIAILLGWFLQKFVSQYVTGFPLFPMAMIGGMIVNWAVQKTSLRDAVNMETFRRIQGFALDFLIVAAVATIKIPLVIANFVPLLIISIVMLITMLFYFFYLGPRFFKKDWFEHSLIVFGAGTGVAAVGYMLLRMVDPKMESDAFIAYGLRAPFVAPFSGGGILTTLMPMLVLTYGALSIGAISIVVFIVVMIICKLTGLYGKPVQVNVPKSRSYSRKVG